MINHKSAELWVLASNPSIPVKNLIDLCGDESALASLAHNPSTPI
jgi:hypothetical protein